MKYQQQFAIGIPTINRADLLEETLLKYKNDFPNTNIFIVDNGHQYLKCREELPKNFRFINNFHNLGVAGSWNQICHFAFEGLMTAEKCHRVILLNDDVYFGKTEEQVLEFISKNPTGIFTATNTWCNIMIDWFTYNLIGEFDESFFPAYFEDNDYCYRAKLLSARVEPNAFMDTEIFRNSMTIAKTPDLNANFDKNRQFYISKWGGLPGEEIFVKPFNQ